MIRLFITFLFFCFCLNGSVRAQTLARELSMEPDKETIADSKIYLQELSEYQKTLTMQESTTYERFSSSTNNYKVQLSIEYEGVYFVSAEDICDELGETLAETSMLFATNGISFMCNGEAVAYSYHVMNNSTGALFYANSISSPFTYKNVYIVAKGQGLLWQNDLSEAPTNSVLNQTFKSSFEIVSRKYVRQDLTDLMEYGTVFGNSTDDGLNEIFDLPGISGSNATLSVQMFESMMWPDSMTCSFYVNGEYAHTTNWNVVCEPIDIEFSVDNAVSNNNSLTTTPVAGEGLAFIKKLKVVYDRFMIDEDGLLKIDNVPIVGDISTVSGFSSTNLCVLDITDKNAPMLVRGRLYEENTNGYSVSFMSTNSAYLAFEYDSNSIRTDAEVSQELVRQVNLLDETNAFDYIMIVPNEGEVGTNFFVALNALAVYRTESGFNVLQVTVQDIYNQFAYGIHDVYAIKDFLSYANTNWTVAPKYVVLCGIGTYDYFDTINVAIPKKTNLIPPLLTFIDIDGMRAADSIFVDFNNDLKPDIPIGRLPFYTAEKIGAYVQKVKNYEEKGIWHADVGFLASRDEGDTSFGDFPSQSDDVASYVPDEYMSVNHLYQTSPVKITSQTINFLNQGCFGLVNYFGHGAYYKFSDSGIKTILENANISSIHNFSQPSVFLQLTCDTGKFTHPFGTSIAETLTGSPNGASALSFACTASSIDKWNYELGQIMFDEQFNKNTHRIGDLVVSSLYRLNVDEQSEYIYQTYTIFGDPALVMQYPTIIADIAYGEGTVEPQRLDLNYGDYAVITYTPAENYFIKNIIVDGQLLPPTNYVEFASVTNNHKVSAVFEGNPTEFVVDSVYGSSNYGLGTNVAPYDTNLTCYVLEPIIMSDTNNMRYVCIGWQGTGSVPSTGFGSSVDFILTNETLITWQWETQVLFSAVSSENCTINPEEQWYTLGETNAVIQAIPANGYHFVNWTGDVPVGSTNLNPVVLTMDRARNLGAFVDLYSITPIAGINGSISPSSIQKYPTGSNSEVFQIIPDDNCHIDDVTIDGVSTGAVINVRFNNITNNHIVEALFATNSIDTFSIRVEHNQFGYVTGPGGAFSVGSTAVFSNISFDHSHVEDIIVDGVSVGISDEYTFEDITTNHEYSVVFAMDTNKLDVIDSYGMANYPEGDNWFDYNEYVSVSMTNDVVVFAGMTTQLFCYGWAGTGSVVSRTGTNTDFSLKTDSSIQWLWNTQYIFEATSVEYGTVISTNGWYDANAVTSAEAIPDYGYHFVSWQGNISENMKTNEHIYPVISNTVSIAATFEINQYQVVSSAGIGGSIVPDGINYVAHGSNITFSIIPTNHYYVEDVVIDGTSIGSTNEYTFDFITQPHTINVIFGTNSYNVVIDSPYDVTIPPVGTNSFVYSNLVEIVITNSIVFDEEILAKYCATGWVGSGSAPAAGNQTNLSFNIEEDSTVNFLWQTNYYIELDCFGSGSIDTTSSWYQIDEIVSVIATSTNENYHFNGWLGDTDGCIISNRQIFIPVNTSRVVNAWFKTNVYIITSSVTEGAGSITPEGDLEISHGQNSPVYYLQPEENAHLVDLKIDNVSTNIMYNYQFSYVTNDHFISATFATNSTGYYSLIVNTPTNGNVVADSYYVQVGESITITNTPDAHYYVSNILVNATNVAPTNTFTIDNIQTNIYLDVIFAINTNKLDVIDSYGNANYPEGDNWFDYNEYVSVSMTNDAVVLAGMTTQLFCYGWAGTGSVESGVGTNTSFNLQTNSSIQWLWNTQYWFEATSDIHGSVISANGWYDEDAVTSVEAIPDYGYHFVSWQGNIPENMKTNEHIYPVISNTVSIAATFEINHYPVSVSYGPGGSIIPIGTNNVAHGSNITFNIMPDGHYHIDEVIVDGELAGITNFWTFNNVTNTHQLYASFEIDKHSLTVESLFGGEVPFGTNLFDYGSLINCSVTNSPIINAETQYVCVGWSAIVGAFTTNGVGTNLTFSIVDDTQLTWNWQTNYWLDIGIGTGLGSVDMTSGWYKADTLLSPTATPTNGYHLSYWSGDTYIWKQFLIMYTNTINIANDYPKRLTANFAPNNVRSENYIPGATNDISSVPAYLNSTEIYPLLPGKDDDISGGICWAVANTDILSYYDRNGYRGIPYWNLIPNGEAPLRQNEIYKSPGMNDANVSSCVTNLGNLYYDPDFNRQENFVTNSIFDGISYTYRDRDTLLQYIDNKPGLEFDVVWHKFAETIESKEIYLNVIADEITAGRPVSLGWYGGNFVAHQVVVLGYKKDIIDSTFYIAYNQGNPDRREYLSFFATSAAVSLSMMTIIPKGTPKDRYEEYGDSSMTNTAVSIHPDDIYDFRQTHCFDETNDVDWIKCSLQYGREYYFDTLNLGSEVGTILELYSASGELIHRSPDTVATNGSTSHISYVAFSNQNVYLKLSPAEENIFGYNSNYDIQVTFSNMFATLEVTSEYGMTSLTNGVYEYLVGSDINCSITNQTVYSSNTNATKYTFKSWQLKNLDDTISGTTSNCLLTITKDSRLDWNWQTNHWVDIQPAEHGSFDAIDSWIPYDSNIVVIANANQYYHFTNWVGTVSTLSTDNNMIYGSVTEPLVISAVFNPDLEEGGTPDWWLASYGLTNDFVFQETNDFDGDGFTSGEEYITGTDPTNIYSLFQLTSLIITTNELNPYTVLTWTYTNNRLYAVERQTNLMYDAIEITNNLPIGIYTDYYDSVNECLYYKINVRLNE